MLLNRGMLLLKSGRLRSIGRMRTECAVMQGELLRWLLRRAQHTALGRKYGYTTLPLTGSPDTLAREYAKRVPLLDYDGQRPWLERAASGEADVVWPGLIARWARSSGTTQRSKLLPVTNEILEYGQYRGSLDALLLHLRQHPESRVLSGRCLTLGGSRQLEVLKGFGNSGAGPSNVRELSADGHFYHSIATDYEAPDGEALTSALTVGDLSAHMLAGAPRWSQHFKAPQTSTALIADFEAKLQAIAQECATERITWLAGVPSWLLLLLRHMEAAQGKSICDIWPDLELLVHGGVGFDPFRAQYRALLPGLLTRETYNASEGFFAVQDDEREAAMQLMLDYGSYYELQEVAPSSGGGLSLGEAQPIWTAEAGKEYALVLSTCGGLWRYALGDVVRVTSTRPLKIVLAGRTKLCINVWGEELMVGNAEAAFAAVCPQYDCEAADWTVAPLDLSAAAPTGDAPSAPPGDATSALAGAALGCHEWIVEWGRGPRDAQAFAAALDAELRRVNSDYDAKRKTGALTELRLTSVAQGTFVRWAAAHGRLGGQNKTPRLQNDRSLANELLGLGG